MENGSIPETCAHKRKLMFYCKMSFLRNSIRHERTTSDQNYKMAELRKELEIKHFRIINSNIRADK